MKKIYVLLLSLFAGSCAFAQSAPVPNAGMETWRTGTSGSTTSIAIQAPTQWYGLDSVAIALLQEFGPLIGHSSPVVAAQVFEESSIVHTGAHSAKLMTLYEDTLHYFAGILSNSVVNINVAALMSGGSTTSAITFSGGTAIAGRIATVSAWVQYTAGKDSTGTTGLDSGSLSVTVHKTILGIDSTVGAGSVNIGPSTSFYQVTANIVYVDSTIGADTVRILFASSGQTDVSDSSTLYVDDVTMTYSPGLDVKNIAVANEVKVYPNPASETLYIDAKGNEGAEFTLISVNGEVVTRGVLDSRNTVDISSLADGLYFYTVIGKDNTVQRGKVSVVK
jgi:hypothetical protein